MLIEFERHVCHNSVAEIPPDLQAGLFSNRCVNWKIQVCTFSLHSWMIRAVLAYLLQGVGFVEVGFVGRTIPSWRMVVENELPELRRFGYELAIIQNASRTD